MARRHGPTDGLAHWPRAGHSQRGDEPLFAGVRTFPIIVLSGYLCGLLTRAGFTWVLPVALGGTCAIVACIVVARS